jgi:hypothetical protein
MIVLLFMRYFLLLVHEMSKVKYLNDLLLAHGHGPSSFSLINIENLLLIEEPTVNNGLTRIGDGRLRYENV